MVFWSLAVFLLCFKFSISSNLLEYELRSYFKQSDIIGSNECGDVLREFAYSASNFTLCAITNARPIHVCERCISHYVTFKVKFKNALNYKINATEANSTCKSLLISKDKWDVFLSFHDNIQNIWNNGHCDACYDWKGETPTPSNSTLNFYKLFNATKDCIDNNYVPSLNNSEQVCELCMENYLELDSYYQSLSGGGIDVDSVCMDIIDSMNNTRIEWSQMLNCCKLRHHPEVVFLACTGVIGSIPLLFYVILRYCGTMRTLPQVLKQTRFKQTFLAALQSRRASSGSTSR